MTLEEQRVIEVARKIDAGVPAYRELEEAFEDLDAQPKHAGPKFKVGDWVRGRHLQLVITQWGIPTKEGFKPSDPYAWEPWQPRDREWVVWRETKYPVVKTDGNLIGLGGVDGEDSSIPFWVNVKHLRPASPAEGGKEGDENAPVKRDSRQVTTSAVPGVSASGQNTPPDDGLSGPEWDVCYGYPDSRQRWADVHRDMTLRREVRALRAEVKALKE